MIITASGFSSENQEKHVLAWHGEIKTINIPCLEVSCLSGAVLQKGSTGASEAAVWEAEQSCPRGECCPGKETQETGISLC